MAQSIWNFFGPTPLTAFPKMSVTTLEWTLPVTPFLPVSAGDPLSQDSLLQSLSTNLLTFCRGVKILSLTPRDHASSYLRPPPSTSLSGGWTSTINEHWRKKKKGPDGDFVPPCIVRVNVCPCWFVPSGIPPGVEERSPTAQCIDWLIKWKTLLSVCTLSSMRCLLETWHGFTSVIRTLLLAGATYARATNDLKEQQIFNWLWFWISVFCDSS